MDKGDKYERIIELAKRRGFFWPSFEIYGGASGFIDIGPLGSLISYKIVDKWRDLFIRRHRILELSTPVITPSIVFKASGHLESFKDPLTMCKKCNRGFRADQLIEEVIGKSIEGSTLDELDRLILENNVRCPECGGELSKTGFFSTMFSTTIGPYSDSIGYARPEAAQGIFIDFKRIFEIARERLPLGIAQIGRAMRNEISPRQGPIRLREFTIMEFEFFYDPDEPRCDRLSELEDFEIAIVPKEARAEGRESSVNITVREALERGYISSEWMAYFMAISSQLLYSSGVPFENQRFHEKLPYERAHYSDQTFDLEVVLDRWGWTEIAGFASRTDYDLKKHMEFSGIDLKVFKGFQKSAEETVKTVKPNSEMIKREFGRDIGEIVRRLSREDVDTIEEALKTKGYFQLDRWKLYPCHIKIMAKREKMAGKKYLPVVVEPSFGFERLFYTVLEYAYTIKDGRVVLKLPKNLEPYQSAVFPLVKKDGLDGEAYKLYQLLIENRIDAFYDEKGSIGRRYARADEIGVPIAITVDYQTLKDGTVTIRDRDTWKQERIDSGKILKYVSHYFD